MSRIYVNFMAVTNTASVPWTYNAFGNSLAGVGVLSNDLKDFTNTSTGISLEVVNAFTGGTGGPQGTMSGYNADWTGPVLDYFYYVSSTVGKLRLGNLVDGSTYTLEAIGSRSPYPDRDTDIAVGGVTQRYDNSGTSTPNAPLVFTGTVSGTTLDIDVASVVNTGHINGFILDVAEPETQPNPTVTNRHTATRYGSGTFTANLTATGNDRLLLAICTGKTNGSSSALPITSLSIGGQVGQIIHTSAIGSPSHSWNNTHIIAFTESQYSAGETTFDVVWPLQQIAVNIIEIQDASQISPFIDFENTPVSLAEIDNYVINFSSTQQDKLGVLFITAADASYFDPTLTAVSANLTNQTFADSTNAMVFTLEDASIDSASESYSATWNHGRAGELTSSLIHGFFTVNPVPANQAPIADDDTFTIFSNVQNGDTVGTYTATDLDGTVVSYSITGTTLAIDNAGLITIADNTGITAGVDITATVTATDNDGATDTALITVTVNPPVNSVVSTTPIRLDEAFTVTTDGQVDLTTATTITATYGGITLSGMAVVDATNVTFNGVTSGLQLGVNHDLVLTVDGLVSDAFAGQLLPPTGYSYVTLVSIDEDSWLNDPDYIANAGGDANNIGTNDQLVYQNVTNEDSLGVVIDNNGLPDMPTATNSTPNQTITWFYLDAQDSYNRGANATLTLSSPSPQETTTDPFAVTVLPPTGQQAVQLGTISTTSPFYGVLETGDIVLYNEVSSPGNYTVTLSVTGIFSLSDTGNDQTIQTIDYSWLDSSSGHSAQAATSHYINLDDTAPIISIVGQSTVTINVGDSYEEQGATWSDNIDGTGDATVGGDTVDTNTAGSYVVTYNHTDAAGNAAQTVTRTVVVQENTAQTTIYENIQNPMPQSIILSSFSPYDLTQHIVNPQGKTLKFTLSQASASLNSGVTLSEQGVLSLVGGANSTVSGILVNVEEL